MPQVKRETFVSRIHKIDTGILTSFVRMYNFDQLFSLRYNYSFRNYVCFICNKNCKKTIYKVKKIIVGLIISATSFMNTVTKTYETMTKKNHQKEIVKIYKEKRVNKKSKY